MSPCHLPLPAAFKEFGDETYKINPFPSGCFRISSVSSFETRGSAGFPSHPISRREPGGLRAPSPSHLFPGDFRETHSPIKARRCSSARRNEFWTICSAKKKSPPPRGLSRCVPWGNAGHFENWLRFGVKHPEVEGGAAARCQDACDAGRAGQPRSSPPAPPGSAAPELSRSSPPARPGPAQQPRRGGSVPSGVPLPTGRTRRVALRARGSCGRAAPAVPCPPRAGAGKGGSEGQRIALGRSTGAVMGRTSGQGAEPSAQQQPGCASGFAASGKAWDSWRLP